MPNSQSVNRCCTNIGQVTQIDADIAAYKVSSFADDVPSQFLIRTQGIKMGQDNAEQLGISGCHRPGKVALRKDDTVKFPVKAYRTLE